MERKNVSSNISYLFLLIFLLGLLFTIFIVFCSDLNSPGVLIIFKKLKTTKLVTYLMLFVIWFIMSVYTIVPGFFNLFILITIGYIVIMNYVK